MNEAEYSTDRLSPRVLVLRAAGTNCDRETEHAFQMAGARTFRHHINRILDSPQMLHDHEILVIPGGFSYGDDVSAGQILANQLKTGLRADLDRFLDEGKLILGICNGFQVLVKAGLLPGNQRWTQQASLITNDSNKYEDRWVWLKICSNRSELMKEQGLIYLPVAHAEGKFVTADPKLLCDLDAAGQVVLRYCTEDGGEPGYPHNPNGSADQIAAICDPTGRVLGLMPHPERYVRPQHHPRWTRRPEEASPHGLRLVHNAVKYCLTRRDDSP